MAFTFILVASRFAPSLCSVSGHVKKNGEEASKLLKHLPTIG